MHIARIDPDMGRKEGYANTNRKRLLRFFLDGIILYNF